MTGTLKMKEAVRFEDQQEQRGQQRMRWLEDITASRDESEQTPGDGDRQGSLACHNPQGHKESETTEQLRTKDRIRQYLKKREGARPF